MSTRRCLACGSQFRPLPLVPDQNHCSAPVCQRERRRLWQRLKRASDPAYRDNHATREQMARMEREMANLQGQYRLVEQTYGQDVLRLVLARGYLMKLLENSSVMRYLRQRNPEVLEQFESIVAAASLEA